MRATRRPAAVSFDGLVVHEGDEGGDDEGSAGLAGLLAGDGGELVAEGFAGAGGHDEKDVASRRWRRGRRPPDWRGRRGSRRWSGGVRQDRHMRL